MSFQQGTPLNHRDGIQDSLEIAVAGLGCTFCFVGTKSFLKYFARNIVSFLEWFVKTLMLLKLKKSLLSLYKIITLYLGHNEDFYHIMLVFSFEI